MSKFFINRPIFAAVISILIVLTGFISIIADAVAGPIEKEVNGVEGMIYMKSTSTNSGTYTLNVTFESGTDPDMASVFVQNRVAAAMSSLPSEVTQLGVKTKKKSTSMVLLISLTSPSGEYDKYFLSNYITLRLKDEISRLEGVGDVSTFGAGDYAMRIWLNPAKLKARGLTTGDVTNALKSQNVQVAAGKIGAAPAPDNVAFEYTINVQGRLSELSQFEDVIIKRGEGGRFTRLKDVARVELASQDYSLNIFLDNEQAAGMMIYQLPGANALDLAAAIKTKMEELSQVFPPGLEYEIPFDTTVFVESSIDEVIVTLFIAILLVFATIFIFLQDWRATLIPAVAIPVSLIGTFGIMLSLGFSINMITLFGLVLAIGIVVDDAIVVVENSVRNIDEHGLPPKEAAIRAMDEVAGPVVATTLVLLAVFVPTAFMGGITGEIYRQFALTISAATLISSINALTMSPALCALLLRPTSKKKNILFRKFDASFDVATTGYMKLVRGGLRKTFIMLVIFAVISAAGFWGFIKLPGGFIPTEDQGYAMATVQLPDGASFNRTDKVVASITEKIVEIGGVSSVTSVPGFSILDGAAASNSGTFFIMFDTFEQRNPEGYTLAYIMGELRKIAAQTQDGIMMSFPPPPIMGLGSTGGFSLQLEDRAGVGFNTLGEVTRDFYMAASEDPRIAASFSTFRANVPQLFAEVNRTKIQDLDVPLSEVFSALQTYLGSSYVNDFNKFNRTFQVRVQA
ncbi:MAG: efflux RND transporter permease subunit, partial [Deltaproteobacteria bacterium]|nr:efflux RND transporter permease subunit [Deltaproteobacteria bacterium]